MCIRDRPDVEQIKMMMMMMMNGLIYIALKLSFVNWLKAGKLRFSDCYTVLLCKDIGAYSTWVLVLVGCSSPFLKPLSPYVHVHWVCDAWPGYLHSHRTPPPFGRYQTMLLGDRGTCVWTTCLKVERLGVEPTTCWSFSGLWQYQIHIWNENSCWKYVLW